MTEQERFILSMIACDEATGKHLLRTPEEWKALNIDIDQYIMLKDEHIIECFQKDRNFALKLDKDTEKGQDIVLLVEASINDEIAVGRLDMSLSHTFNPIGHKYYTARLSSGVTVNRILGWIDPELIESE